MKTGKIFEILVKSILISVGFSEVESDGLYIFDGSPGQMIQGLGEAHNADVLLEPPVQTPFYSLTRLLVECKDYNKKIGLNTVRSALGLREDVNHFDIVDIHELLARRSNRRRGLVYNYTRYSYQVALAALNGFTVPAQKFAATYRIPLIEFNKMPFWNNFEHRLANWKSDDDLKDPHADMEIEREIHTFAEDIGKHMAIAITNSGQMLFLYRIHAGNEWFYDEYSLHWRSTREPWELCSGDNVYLFQLPEDVMKLWITHSANQLEKKQTAIDYKERFFSNMVVYYKEYGLPKIKMISIDRERLERAREELR